MKLPYEIRRTELAHYGNDAYYRFDLVCAANGAVLVSSGSNKAAAPGWMVRRQGELNAKHRWREIEKCK